MESPLSPGQVLLKDLIAVGSSCYNRQPQAKKEAEVEEREDEDEEEEEEGTGGVEAPGNPQCPPLKTAGRPGQCRSTVVPFHRQGRERGRGNGLQVTGRSLDTMIRLPACCVELPLLDEGGAACNLENGVRKVSVFSAVKPSNVDREKFKFFLSDFTYNPQFEYHHPVPCAVLDRYGTASDRFLTQAVRILEKTLGKYGTYERFELVTGGNLLSKNKIKSHVKKYMEKEGCVGEIGVHLSDDLLSRASMSVMNSRSTLTIKVSAAREFWLEGMLRHEIGTHYFRGTNNSQQPWSSVSGRRALELKPHNPTEEGLASIHSVLHRKDPTLWRAALLYYTVHRAGRLAFVELFQDLRRFVRDPRTRWDYCLRAKRGQADTAQPGCFSKDQVYLDGVLQLLRYREAIDFQLLVSLGKVSFEDAGRLRDLAVTEHTRLPHFLLDQPSYQSHLHRIMEANLLTDSELQTLI